MTEHHCMQRSRLLRIESELAAQNAQYYERDQIVKSALLELANEIRSIANNVKEILDVMQETTQRQLRTAFIKIDELASRFETDDDANG